MSSQTQESQIFLALNAIRTNKKISIWRVAKMYNVPYTSLYNRLKGRVSKAEKRNPRHKLTSAKEDTIIQYTLDLDSQGFPP
jgi:Psq-like protein